MTDLRYSKDLEEDRLFWEVVPHYKDAQDTIIATVHEAFGASPEKELSVLEIGCGTGLTTERILAADPRIVLTSIDNVDYVVEQAQIRLADQGKGRLTIKYADALKYLQRQTSTSLDMIVSALVLHNCPSEYRNQVFAQIYRVLKDGGIFINIDKIAQDDETEHQAALDWQIKEFDKFATIGHPDLKEKWTQHYVDDEKPGILLYEHDYLGVLHSMGFKDVRRTYRYQMEAGYVAEK